MHRCKAITAKNTGGDVIERQLVERTGLQKLLSCNRGLITSVHLMLCLVVGRGHGQSVTTLVLHIVRVAFYPNELHFMAGIDGKKPAPQVSILLPRKPLFHPSEHPTLLYRLDHIFRIRIDGDLTTRILEQLQRHNNAHQLHTVVGRKAITSAYFLAKIPRHQHDAKATRAGISKCRSIRIDRYDGRGAQTLLLREFGSIKRPSIFNLQSL
jgi:hypothetical protein